MKARFLTAVLVLVPLAGGCRAPAPPPADVAMPPPTTVAATPDAPASPAETPTPTATTVPNSPAATVAYLKALRQTEQTRSALLSEAFGPLMLMTLPKVLSEGPATPEPPSDADPAETPGRIKETFTRKSADLWDTFAQQPVPENCQTLSQRYQAFYDTDANWLKEEADFAQKMQDDPEAGAAQLHANRDEAQKHTAERERMAEEINQEIERVRTADPAVEEQVPAFKLYPTSGS